MKKTFLLITVVLVLFGCNSVYKENLDAADKALEDGDFENALIYYNTALEEKPDDSEIIDIVTLLNDYDILQKKIADFKWQDAFDLANAMMKNEAMNSSLEKEVVKAFATIEDEQKKKR